MDTAEPRILVVFHTSEGHTAKIAQRIADRLRSTGADVELHEADRAPGPVGFDGVVLGDSIHMGHHSKAIREYSKTHAEAIAAMPSALFQVSLASAAQDEEHDREAHRYVAELLQEANLDPDVVGLFAGALAYARYGWIKRRVLQKIAESEGLPTDPDHDVEFTDWDVVDHFADDIAALATLAHRPKVS